MAIILQKLVSKGLNKPDAEIAFRHNGTLVRGPSDTGKSYIRDCLWYLLGGDKIPKEIPQAKGYDSLYLEFKSADGNIYTIKRSLFGGGAEIYLSPIHNIKIGSPLPDEIGQLLVGLSGAKDKLLLRSLSKRGPMTGGDLRHWCLLSQPAMISEEATTGTPTEKTQRKAAFSVFLTGQDDASFILAQTKDEKIKFSTLVATIERDLERVKSELPATRTKDEIQDALLKVDGTLDILSNQQIERSSQLRTIRSSLNEIFNTLSHAESKLSQSMLMASRFALLDEKYANDLSRLRAVGDGIAVFETIYSQPCLLCGTPAEEQLDITMIASNAAKQRMAMAAEAKKIDLLRSGLKEASARENQLILKLTAEVENLKGNLSEVSKQEKNALSNSNLEFSASPKELAEARTEYTAQIRLFEEVERLNSERNRINSLLPTIKVKSPERHTDIDAVTIAKITKELLGSWGFTGLENIELNAAECDINIDGRPRLTYGAGKRAIFLSAMMVALMQHAMNKKHPHMGVVVLDSPIKSYSDPINVSDVTVSPTIVRDSFYNWLANWNGPGQVIVLENEPIQEDVSVRLLPIVFTGIESEGRAGFYPNTNEETKKS